MSRLAPNAELAHPLLPPLSTRHSLYPLRAVDRVCDLLEVLAEQPSTGASLASIAAAARLPKSSALRYLAALELRGYVSRNERASTYRLAATAPQWLGRNPNHERIVHVARPVLRQLRERELTSVQLATLDGDAVRLLWFQQNAHSSECLEIGDRVPLHSTAIGKVIAAQLADEVVERLLDSSGMPTATATTLPSPTSFLRELHRVRGDGFAWSNGEQWRGLRAVAVPIGSEPFALGIAARESLLVGDRIPAMARVLRRAAAAIVRDLRG